MFYRMRFASPTSLIWPAYDRSRPELVNDPWIVATQFLEELVKGGFRPGPLEYDDRLLTLGHEWDNRFLALRDASVDNQVVRAIQSRMARYRGKQLGRLKLAPLNWTSLRSDVEPFNRIVYQISWDDFADGTIALQRADRKIWGPAGGWRIWELTP